MCMSVRLGTTSSALSMISPHQSGFWERDGHRLRCTPDFVDYEEVTSNT